MNEPASHQVGITWDNAAVVALAVVAAAENPALAAFIKREIDSLCASRVPDDSALESEGSDSE